MIEYYRKDDFSISRWSGGETRELLLLPKDASYKERNFSFRLSSATIDVPCSTFTHLKGIKRFITPLTNPFLLEVNGDKPFLLFPLEVFEFSGSDEVRSYGMSVDFNLMLDERRASGWMKTLKKATEQKEINSKMGDAFWIFSYVPNKVVLNDEEYVMDELSLFVMKNIEKDLTFSSSEGLIYGCIKTYF